MDRDSISRREFLATAGIATATGLGATGFLAEQSRGADEKGNQGQPSSGGSGKQVALVCDPADAVAATPPAQWALAELRDVLSAKGIGVKQYANIGQTQPNEFCIVAAGTKSAALKKLIESSKTKIPEGPEVVALASAGVDNRQTLFACGSDGRGLAYALLEAADRIKHADPPLAALETQKPVIERPANAIRSIGRLFTSDVEDLPWYRDKKFWRDYLTMLATERFNRFNLTLGLGYDFATDIRDSYFYFAYPFFLEVPGYKVRAVNLPDKERDENLAMLKFISDESARRGVDFQLGIWCHAYRWNNSAKANYTIEGLNSDNHGPYCRDALAALLKACPSISGVTLRTHGESGVTEGSYDFWKTIFYGVAKSGRKVEIDLHAKGIDQKMIDNALATGMPVNVSPKYWAEHTGLPYQPASIRELERATTPDAKGALMSLSNGSRKFMRYSYGDLLRDDRKYGVLFRMWPGSMKLLMWGDPEMAAAWGRYASFCGSLGMEIQEPLSFKGKQGSGLPGGRNAYQDAALKPAADWEKWAYTYRLWGRLQYNPDTEPEVWRRMLRTRWQAAAPAAEAALAHSSRIIPLITTAHLPSAANANYWPEIYTNMSISDSSVKSPYSDTPEPKRFGTVSPLDPELFSTIDECAAELLEEKSSGKFSPMNVVGWLSEMVQAAKENLVPIQKQIRQEKNPELQRLAADVNIQIGLGEFYRQKILATLSYAIYDKTKIRKFLEDAVTEYETASAEWENFAKNAVDVYEHDITFGSAKHLRGDWSDRLSAINDDVERLKKILESADHPSPFKLPTMGPSTIDQLRNRLGEGGITIAPFVNCTHQPAISFDATKEHQIILEIAPTPGPARVSSVTLNFRHVNQAEKYQTAEMKADGNRWVATIPASYIKSPYALQYFFRLHCRDSGAGHYPDLGANLCNQPYFVVQKA